MTSNERRDASGKVARRRSQPRGVRGDRRVERVKEAQREWAAPRGGRAWINGREVGGVDPRYIHLSDWLD